MSNQEPDGWCAWHPEHGYASATEDGGIFVAPEQEMLTLSNDSPHSRQMRKEGWQIKPVMLISPQELTRLRAISSWASAATNHIGREIQRRQLGGENDRAKELQLFLSQYHKLMQYDAITEAKP